jgi:hypothetical protein
VSFLEVLSILRPAVTAAQTADECNKYTKGEYLDESDDDPNYLWGSVRGDHVCYRGAPQENGGETQAYLMNPVTR